MSVLLNLLKISPLYVQNLVRSCWQFEHCSSGSYGCSASKGLSPPLPLLDACSVNSDMIALSHISVLVTARQGLELVVHHGRCICVLTQICVLCVLRAGIVMAGTGAHQQAPQISVLCRL